MLHEYGRVCGEKIRLFNRSGKTDTMGALGTQVTFAVPTLIQLLIFTLRGTKESTNTT